MIARLAAAAALLIAAAPASVSAQEALMVCDSPGIIDGDTFRCDGALRIRLWGVNAPERYEQEGPAATRALTDLTRGRTLVCKRKGKSYERVVAQCWIGDLDVAAELVRQGAAVDDPRYSRGRYANQPLTSPGSSRPAPAPAHPAPPGSRR